MKDRCKELPEELWESILDRLVLDNNYVNSKSPSVVCKQFLSITNRLRRKFVADDYVLRANRCDALSRAFKRFRNLKEIGLYPKRNLSDVNSPILKIAYSGLDLQSICFYCFPISPSAASFRSLGCSMSNLKVLRCSRFVSLRDLDLVDIADALPQLEELDIRYPQYREKKKFEPSEVGYTKLSNHMVTDAGIEAISLKLQGLRRINICGIKGCSDVSLIALSSNCVHLNEIKCRQSGITKQGICWVLCHSTTLISLHADFYGSSIPFDDLKISAIGLRELAMRGFMVDLEWLVRSLAKAGVLLEKLKLYGGGPYGLNVTEFPAILCACPTLKHCTLKVGHRINDNQMSEICQYLPNLVSIDVSYFIGVTAATFLVFAKECPALSKITMRFGYLEPIQADFIMNLERNCRVRYLDLSYSTLLDVNLLEDIVVVCPNLHTLKIPHTKETTGGSFLKKFETRQIKIEYR